MSKYGEFLKQQAEKQNIFFYGEGYKKVSNQYFTWKRVIDNDNITIVTNNIVFVKGCPVLVVDHNKAVYIKFCIAVENYDNNLKAYAIKLSRKYFKTYTFKSDFNDYIFDKEATFDDFLQIAKEQDNLNLSWKESKII